MTMLGKLNKENDLRKVWANEASDFTNWLAKKENLSILSEEVGIDLEVITTEAKTGSFSADILASEQNTDKKVIIENQLEMTDHDHLGKLITYGSGHDAGTIIWVVREVREEHRRAIDWLNEHTDDEINIFLCEIELWQIDDSRFAPKFEIVSRPNNWAKTVKKSTNELSGVQLTQYNYWANLKEYIDKNSKILKSRQPKPRNSYDITIGNNSAHIYLVTNSTKKLIITGIYIENDETLYYYLENHKNEIENELGFKLKWENLEKNKRSKIYIEKNLNPMDEKNWEECCKWHLSISERLFNSFTDRIKEFDK